MTQRILILNIKNSAFIHIVFCYMYVYLFVAYTIVLFYVQPGDVSSLVQVWVVDLQRSQFLQQDLYPVFMFLINVIF